MAEPLESGPRLREAPYKAQKMGSQHRGSSGTNVCVEGFLEEVKLRGQERERHRRSPSGRKTTSKAEGEKSGQNEDGAGWMGGPLPRSRSGAP